jgi:DNA recombination protein RmuC
MSGAVFLVLGAALALAVGWGVARWLAQWRESFERRVEEKLGEERERWWQALLERFDKLHERLDESKRFMTGRVDRAEQAVRQVTQHLGKLETATAQLLQTNAQILDFQKMLRSPQVRGGFGEVLLENILRDILPRTHYALQFTLSTGEVADAIVRLPDGHIVAVDAKFPLANFERLRVTRDEEQKRRLLSAFVQDVKARVREISRKYISSADRTLDFAFMYLPIESVYHAIWSHKDLWEFCQQQRVYPISPNTFVPYLRTILIGLRGMEINRRAKEIARQLGRLRNEAARLQEGFEVLGRHLGNARTKYEEVSRRLVRLTDYAARVELPGADAESTRELPPPETGGEKVESQATREGEK